MSSDRSAPRADDRYFVLRLNSEGKVAQVSSLVCTSDEAALLWAGHLEDGGAFEVWTREGCIGRVPGDQAEVSS
jgi:hypothetical protein